jgi:Plasma-membrane choline transporter
MVVAFAVSKWYFSREKFKTGSWTVIFSFVKVCTFHLGTCAYGSFVIAIVQFIRPVLAKFQKTVQKYDKSKVATILLCCCQCCLWCLQCILKFISKNAYVQTAIFGTSFCKSCRQAFALIARNAARVAAITCKENARDIDL